MIMSHYFYDLTHFRGQGRNTEFFSFGFRFKRRHPKVILKLSDLQLESRNSTLRSFYKAFLKNIRSKALCVGGEIDIYEAINLCFFQGDSSIQWLLFSRTIVRSYSEVFEFNSFSLVFLTKQQDYKIGIRPKIIVYTVLN